MSGSAVYRFDDNSIYIIMAVAVAVSFYLLLLLLFNRITAGIFNDKKWELRTFAFIFLSITGLTVIISGLAILLSKTDFNEIRHSGNTIILTHNKNLWKHYELDRESIRIDYESEPAYKGSKSRVYYAVLTGADGTKIRSPHLSESKDEATDIMNRALSGSALGDTADGWPACLRYLAFGSGGGLLLFILTLLVALPAAIRSRKGSKS